MTRAMLGANSQHEAKYLNRVLRRTLAQDRPHGLSKARDHIVVLTTVLGYLLLYPRGRQRPVHAHVGLQIGGTTVHNLSKLVSNGTISSGEAELNSAVKGVSEASGLWELQKEIFRKSTGVVLTGGGNLCKGMFFRQ